MPRHARALTDGEVELARSVFGDAIDYARVRVCRSKWTFFQPRRVVMAPMGALHFHPHGDLYCDDFGAASQSLKGLFIHEMVHVWQYQHFGWGYIPRSLWETVTQSDTYVVHYDEKKKFLDYYLSMLFNT